MEKVSFDAESMLEWFKNLKGKERDFVKRFALNVHNRDESKSPLEALIDARKAFILGKAIGVLAYIELKTPQQIWKELSES